MAEWKGRNLKLRVRHCDELAGHATADILADPSAVLLAMQKTSVAFPIAEQITGWERKRLQDLEPDEFFELVGLLRDVVLDFFRPDTLVHRFLTQVMTERTETLTEFGKMPEPDSTSGLSSGNTPESSDSGPQNST